MFVIGGGKLADQIVNLLERVQSEANNKLDKIKDYLDLTKEVDKLRESLNVMTIEKSQINEKYEKREREIEHKLGLERLRQETELKLGLREQTVKIREENLTADRDRFTKEMAFVTQRFEQETGYLKDMIKPLLEALPKMTIKENVTKRR